MKILTAGPALWVPTGYGVQLRELCRRLKDAGHSVVHFAYAGVEGGQVTFDDILHLPAPDKTSHGNRIIRPIYELVKPDVVLSLGDTWAMWGYGGSEMNWAAWTPIDHVGLHWTTRDVLQTEARWPIAISQHGADAMREANIEPSATIPHGFLEWAHPDTDARLAWRNASGIPADAFVIGSVGMNSWWPERKGYHRLLYAFRDALARGGSFAASPEDGGAVVYLHSTTTNYVGTPESGFDYAKLAEELGIHERVFFTQPIAYALGFDGEAMRAMYNGFDCFALPTFGEGFGVPLIEAQACGLPCIATATTAIPELLAGEDHSQIITEGVIYSRDGSYWETPSVEHLTQLLRAQYGAQYDRERIAAEIAPYAWSAVWEDCWEPFLAQIQDEVGSAPTHAVVDMSKILDPKLEWVEALPTRDGATGAIIGRARDTQPINPLFADCIVKVQPQAKKVGLRSPTEEAELMANLRSQLFAFHCFVANDAIVPVLRGWKEGGYEGYSMAAYDTSLEGVLSLTWPEAADIKRQVDLTLSGLQRAGWAHRDIHPTNLLIRRLESDPSQWRAALADFTWADTIPPGEESVDIIGGGPQAVPSVRLGLDERGIHTIYRALARKVFPGVDEYVENKGSSGATIPYQQIMGWGERSCEERWAQLGLDAKDAVKGKSILDLGCNLGLFGWEAYRSGASAYYGVEPDDVTYSAAIDLADAWIPDESPYFDHGMYRVSVGVPGEQPGVVPTADIGLCLGLVMHVESPDVLYERMQAQAPVWYFEAPRPDEYESGKSLPEWTAELEEAGFVVEGRGESDRGRFLFRLTSPKEAE